MRVSYDLNFKKFLDLWSKAEKGKDKKAQYKLGSLCFKSKHPDALITYDIWNNPSKTDKEESKLFQKYLDDDEFANKIDEKLDVREEQMNIDNIINTALSGSSDAQNRLGYYYYNGNEFEKDIQEAIFWYEKAAAQGNDAAMERLAEHYNKTGQYKESAEWYRRYTEERIKWRNERLNW